MENAAFLGNVIFACTPFFSVLTWESILLLSFRDSLTTKEMRAKQALLSFFFFTAIDWASIFIYAFLPQYFIYINPLAYLSFLIIPVLFYKFLKVIIVQNDFGRFSWLHFIFPVLISTFLFVWSFFVPEDIQHPFIPGVGYVYPGKEVYFRFFLSESFLRFVITFIYMVLSFVCLYRDYHHICPNQENVKQTKQWYILLIAFMATLFSTSLIFLFIPRSEMLQSAVFAVIICIFICQYTVLTYMIIGRRFLILNVMQVCDVNELTKGELEKQLKKYKPYLDPELRLTDLADSLQVDANKLSKFINSTYGMTFSRYINQHRFREVQRLCSLPSNTGKSLRELAGMAGFASFRNYQRVKRIFDNPENIDKTP